MIIFVKTCLVLLECGLLTTAGLMLYDAIEYRRKAARHSRF